MLLNVKTYIHVIPWMLKAGQCAEFFSCRDTRPVPGTHIGRI